METDGKSFERALELADFLRLHVYGRSRVPSLTALLQRQFRPLPPSPFRPDALLIQQPEWFKQTALDLQRRRDDELLFHQQAREIALLAERQMREEDREIRRLQAARHRDQDRLLLDRALRELAMAAREHPQLPDGWDAFHT